MKVGWRAAKTLRRHGAIEGGTWHRTCAAAWRLTAIRRRSGFRTTISWHRLGLGQHCKSHTTGKGSYGGKSTHNTISF